MGWLIENKGKFTASDEGIKRFWLSILTEDITSQLIDVSKQLKIDTSTLVLTGTKLIISLLRARRIPDDLGDFLRVRDRELLAELYGIVRGREVTV